MPLNYKLRHRNIVAENPGVCAKSSLRFCAKGSRSEIEKIAIAIKRAIADLPYESCQGGRSTKSS